MTYLREVLEKHIDEVFIECQKRRHIESGDITPHDQLQLDNILDTLEHHINTILDYELPSYNMCSALEVLKDYHCFKRGEVVFCSESDETYFWIERNNMNYALPHEVCRKIN